MPAQFFPCPLSTGQRSSDSIRSLYQWALLDFHPRDGRCAPIGSGYRVRGMPTQRTLTCHSSRRRLEAASGNRIELYHQGRVVMPAETSSNPEGDRHANIW